MTVHDTNFWNGKFEVGGEKLDDAGGGEVALRRFADGNFEMILAQLPEFLPFHSRLHFRMDVLHLAAVPAQ